MPVEIDHRQLPLDRNPLRTLNAETLNWVREHWHRGGLLCNHNEDLNMALQAYDGCTWTRNIPLAIVAVWGALERLFSPARAELKFRVSANIAAFLEPPGDGRLALFKKVQKLYDARSAAAHGAGQETADAFMDSSALLRRVLIRTIESNKVPRREDLDMALFGASA